MSLSEFQQLSYDFETRAAPAAFLLERTWSFGDVENGGVYYHPQLTHYAHQAFEQFFLDRTGLHYSDLSGRRDENESRRKRHKPPLQRMTFPVQWLHQFMKSPMYAGDSFRISIDTMDLHPKRIAVRAWVWLASSALAGVVVWVRWAKELEPIEKTIPIPEWFPRLPPGSA